MTVIEVSSVAALNEVLDNNANVVVDFAAEAWCVPCQRLKPHYDAVAGKMEGVKFVHVDIDKADYALVESYQVAGVPTVLAFDNGEVVEKIGPTYHTAPKLTTKLNELFIKE